MLSRMNKLNALDPMVQNVSKAIQDSNDEQRKEIAKAMTNLFFDTCTAEMVERYETECGIEKKPDELDDRRAAIMAKWRSSTNCSVASLQQIAESWALGEADIDYIDSAIRVTFSDKGVPADLDGLKDMLEEAKPAHIPIEYIINYYTWKDIKTSTWASLKAKTWADVKVR